MADLNKVIESLEFCAIGAECDHCKYAQENNGNYEGCHHLMADAAELLKSQQAEIKKNELDKSWEDSPDRMNGCGW